MVADLMVDQPSQAALAAIVRGRTDSPEKGYESAGSGRGRFLQNSQQNEHPIVTKMSRSMAIMKEILAGEAALAEKRNALSKEQSLLDEREKIAQWFQPISETEADKQQNGNEQLNKDKDRESLSKELD
jgi:hypothetical protein